MSLLVLPALTSLHEALRRLVNDIHLVVLDLPLDVIELHIHSDAQAKDVLFD